MFSASAFIASEDGPDQVTKYLIHCWAFVSVISLLGYAVVLPR
jgi:hypothetical protein